jgi:hypothetical protein
VITKDPMIAAAQAAGLTLARGIAAGWWSLESLDAPPCPKDWKLHPYRNLARAWINANPREWHAMQERAYTDDTLARPPWMA